MGAWDVGFLDNDNALDTIGDFEHYLLEKKLSKEEALEKALYECRFEEDSIYALAETDLEDNENKKIHVTLKK